MSLIVSQNLILSQVQEFPAWSPVVGWHNLVTVENITADTEDELHPAENLATVRTPERWQAADTTEQRIVVEPDYIGAIDYVAVARHNFGSALIEVSVEGYTETDEEGDPVWVELVEGVLLANDRAVMFRFSPDSYIGVCLRLKTGTAVARAAVLYVGKLLIIPPHIQPDFTPLPYGRVVENVSDFTEHGDFLGNIVLNTTLESSVSLPYLDPEWYREEMDPFIEASATAPFFFAWDPLNYPREVGFSVIRQGSNPQPSIHLVTGHMSIDLQMTGIA